MAGVWAAASKPTDEVGLKVLGQQVSRWMLPVVEVATGENMAGSKFSFSAEKSTATSPKSFGQASSLDNRPENINRKRISIHFLDNKQTPHVVIFALLSCPAALSVGV